MHYKKPYYTDCIGMVSHLCVFSDDLWVLFSKNTLSQRPHWYDFSPKCVLIWSSALLPSDKALSHRLHWYSFSPVCALRCFIGVLMSEIIFLQWLPSYGFSPLKNPYYTECNDMVSTFCVSSYDLIKIFPLRKLCLYSCTYCSPESKCGY